MFTAEELRRLENLKVIRVMGAESIHAKPSTVELVIPPHVERDFVNFMELLELKTEQDIAFDRYKDKLTKTLGLDEKLVMEDD